MNAHKRANDLFNVSLAAMLLTLVATLRMTFSLSQILAPVNSKAKPAKTASQKPTEHAPASITAGSG